MTDILSRPVIPVANDSDAETTYEAIAPYLDADSKPMLVNVIEKAGGGIDKASVEQREAVAEEAFETFARLAAAEGVSVEEEIRYGTDVAETIREAARDHDATAVAFVSRGGGRIVQFLSGNVRSKLVDDPAVPVVVLPER